MEKQKRKALTLKDKYDIIQKLHNGAKQSDICHQMSLLKSTVSITWHKRKDILLSYKSNVKVKFRRLKKSAHVELDKELLKWFTQKTRECSLKWPNSGPFSFSFFSEPRI